MTKSQKERRVDIVHDTNCMRAYVRSHNVGSTTEGGKYYGMSMARIDANFLSNPDAGRVNRQYYREFGFGRSSGGVANFNFICDEDTCLKR